MMRAITHSPMVAAFVALLAACSSYDSADRALAPLEPQARPSIGPLWVDVTTAAPLAPAPPLTRSGKGEAALKGAGASVLVGLQAGATTADPFGLALMIALGIVAAPFVALGAAVATPSTVRVAEGSAEIVEAITNIRWDAAFKDAMEKALAQQGQVMAETPPADGSRLKLSIEGPWLVVESSAALPTLTVHGELATGKACLVDRRWRWNGESDDFSDLGEERATKYRAQMEQGLAALAEAVVADLLVAEVPRLTAYDEETGPGHDGRPLMISHPMDFEKQVGSWDKTPEEAARAPRCSGLAADAPPALTPPTRPDPCRGRACRHLAGGEIEVKSEAGSQKSE